MSAQLLAAITSEAAALRRFIAVLEEEQKLLISGEADAVLPLLEQKTELIAALGTTGQQRDAALQALGVAISREATETWFSGASNELKQQWQDLLQLAQTANQINTSNGQLINTRLQYNQQALAILMSTSGEPSDNSTYGPDGHQKHDGGSRPLGSA